MAYIGKSPSTGVRNRFIYTATAGQTTFSGTDDHNRTLSYTDAEFTDVFLNGVKLDKSDYTATSGTSIVLDSGATVGDTLEILGFDTFSVFSGDFSQDVTVGGDLTISDKIIHSGDTNTAIRFPAADTVTVETGGAERMRMTSNGILGINTTSPSNANLDVEGRGRFLQDAAATTGAVIIRESSGGVGGHLQFVTNDNTGQRGYIAVDSSSNMQFGTSAERMRILSGGGLTFNGDTATANALDDYEEGTFSPTLGATSSNPTIAYSQRQGRYVKVGNIVHFAVHILCGSFSGGSGSLQIQNLPFTMENVSNMFYAVTIGLSNNFTTTAPQGGLVLPNTTTMNLYHNEGTNSYSDLRVQTDVLAGTATSQIICSGSYRTT